MIYIENKDGVQRVVIPTNDTNVEYVNFIPQEGDSDYYTKEQTDERITQSSTAVLGEVGDWLSFYATTDYVHDAVENVTVDLTGYATEDYVDAEIQKIPKPDMSDYYTKEETDREIDNALSAAPSMLESVGFVTKEWMNREGYATQDWVDMNYATTQYVDDAVANIPTGGGTEPFIVEVSSLEPITKTEFDQLFESYNQGIPSYIRKSGLPEQLLPVVGIQGTMTGIMPVAKMWVINKSNLIEYTRSIGPNIGYTTIPLGGSGGSTDMSNYYTKGEVDTIKDDLQGQITANNDTINGIELRVKDIEMNGGGSGGASGAMLYQALWDDANGGYTRVTNQMVSDMFNSYFNDHLLVQLQMGDNIYTVYFATDEKPFYRVYVLAANIMGELEGHRDYPLEDAIYKETYLGTGGSGGGSADIDWHNVPYLTVTGSAVFNSEVRFNASGYKDIASGIRCAFKTTKSQSVDQWTRFIHAGTDDENIYFVSSDEAGNTQLAMIDTEGNIYEGKDKLSDKYATKGYVDDLIININNVLSNI